MRRRSTSPSSASASGPSSSPSTRSIPHAQHATPSASATGRSSTPSATPSASRSATPTIAELLQDPDVDVVHINSPIPDHAWMSIAALKAGKHVACTVPMATSIADCKKIVDLVEADRPEAT